MTVLEFTGWDFREAGPTDAEHTALLLPGGMCTAAFYEEVLAEPAVAGMHLVAVTLPGHGGTRPPDDLTIENYARMAADLAADLACDVVVGHSMGANVALEMAASGAFSGPLVLLAASFSRQDESLFLRILDRLGRVLGPLPFEFMLKILGSAVKGSPCPRSAFVSWWRSCGRTTHGSCDAESTAICGIWTATGRSPHDSANPACRRGWSTVNAATAE